MSEELSIEQLQQRRIQRFKAFIDKNLSHVPEIKKALADLSDYSIIDFSKTVKSLVYPERDNLEHWLKKTCTNFNVKHDDIKPEIQALLIKWLQYFCQLVEEVGLA